LAKKEARTLPPDELTHLNKRVWTLFQLAGFKTQPSTASPSEHEIELENGIKKPVDLFAREPELNITIIGSNKGGISIAGFHDHVAGLNELRSVSKADAALFVATGRELSEKEIRYLFQKQIQFWTERQLRYFEALAKAIGKFARYEIMHSMDIRTADQSTNTSVPALALRQPDRLDSSGVELYAFTLPAAKLLEISSVLRRARTNSFTYQRILSRERLPRIAEFLRTSGAILPTCIVAHLSDNTTVEAMPQEVQKKLAKGQRIVTLTIPNEYSSLEIIDGQHRLFGFAHTPKRVAERFNLIVVGIKHLSTDKRSRTFVAINDKAKRVDPSLVSFLQYTDNEATCRKHPYLMAIKIAVELNKRDPFKNSIRLWDEGPQTITLKGISGYDLKGMVGDNGALRKYYPNSSATYVGVLRLYFGVIQEVFESEWKEPKKYIIATTRGVTALLKLLKSILKNEQARVDGAQIKGYMQIIKSHWVKHTWETSKLDTSYSASQGWKQFHRDLVRTIQQVKRRFRE
jgi:DNA sulfur modification protein DndB